MNRIIDKKTSRNIASYVLAAITVFSYGLNSQLAVIPESVTELKIYGSAVFRFLAELVYSSKTLDWFSVLIFVAVAYLYQKQLFKNKNGKSRIMVFSVSAVIVFALLLCHSYSSVNSWDLVFGSKTIFAKALIKTIGFTPFMYIAVDYLTNLNFVVTQENAYTLKPVKTIATITFALMLCWIPYFVLLYPGCLAPDGFDQLAQAMNEEEYCWTIRTMIPLDENVILNNHHPILYTGILKLVTIFAQAIDSFEIAFEFLCIIQSFFLALSFSYMIYVMKKHRANKIFLVCTLAFCMLNPLIPIYGMTIVKDSLFCIMIVFTAVQLYEIITLEKISVIRGIFFALTVLILLFTRNNSMYILALIAICIGFCYWKRKLNMIKMVSLILVPVVIFQIGFINILCPILGISQGSPREMLSVPFLQTARYIKEHREDITPEEEQVIANILNCNGDIDVLAEVYDSDHADSVKNRFNKNATTEDLISYVKVWFKGLIKHPLTYVEAYLNLHYGWLSFEGNNFIAYSNVGTLKVSEMIEEYEGYMGNASMRAIVNRTLDLLNKNPVTVIFLEMATYTWLYLLLLYHIIKRKNKAGFIVCSLAFFNYLISLLGPVAYMRYVIPMVCLAPFAIFIVFKNNKKETKDDGQNSSSDTLLQRSENN